ncbi:MAG: TIM barrel protein [Saprospiraceae bacterium]
MPTNNYPKLHNASWPGVVGKGPGSEPAISLDKMIELTVNASVDGVKFDGFDLFLADPHMDIDSSEDDIKRMAEKAQANELDIGSVIAPVWTPTGGGSAMGSKTERDQFVTQVHKACKIALKLRDLGVRPNGIVRIDSSCDPSAWAADPVRNTELIAQTFRQACDVAADYGESLAAEGEICWGGMQGWKTMIQTLEAVDRPNIGFQADMAHTLLYLLGYNKEDERILPPDFQWDDRATLTESLKVLTAALRPWTIDFHVAQNDGTVFGSGSHDKTGRHCLATDPNGKLDIATDAGHWLRNEDGTLTKKMRHICWDGCMFPNAVMMQQQTWNDILATMIKVRRQHGWYEAE